MNNRLFVIMLSIAVTMMFYSRIHAQSEYELAQIVTERNQIMKSMLKSYFPLISIKDGKNSDFQSGADAALAIAEGMSSSLSLFPAGSAKGEAPGSRAKPEVWTDSEGFQSAAEDLIEAANMLAEISKQENVESFVSQFALLESACIACHEFKPSAGGKYRYGH